MGKQENKPNVISISLHRMDPAVREKLLSLTGTGEKSRYINRLVLADLQTQVEQKPQIDRTEVEKIVRHVLKTEGFAPTGRRKIVAGEAEEAKKEALKKVLASIDQLIVVQ